MCCGLVVVMCVGMAIAIISMRMQVIFCLYSFKKKKNPTTTEHDNNNGQAAIMAMCFVLLYYLAPALLAKISLVCGRARTQLKLQPAQVCCNYTSKTLKI
jgi:hypothetical protein